MGPTGRPPETDLIMEFQGGLKTYRLRIEMHLALDEGTFEDLRGLLENDQFANAVSLVLNQDTFDAASEKMIKIALNPSGYTVTAANTAS